MKATFIEGLQNGLIALLIKGPLGMVMLAAFEYMGTFDMFSLPHLTWAQRYAVAALIAMLA